MSAPGRARYRLAEGIEQFLGDPADPDTVFSYANCVALDEREEFPAEICERLDAWGLPDYYVPVEYGGRLDDYEQFVQLMRAVSRRDLTVAVGHGKTYLGAAAVWVGGSRSQAERLAADIRAGTPVSLGLTERAHGSDLLAGEVSAVPVEDGAASLAYAISGEKWLINNATRGGRLTLLARTDPAGGPRGFSLLLVDKRGLRPGGYTTLDKVRTLGVRGADISGIAFHRAEVPGGALIGPAGSGIETILKALQLTRISCAALSLGAADHALALALDFARTRELYGRTLIELPKTRHTLASAAADLLAAEALAIVASRAVHVLTGELGEVSAVAKYLIPTGTDALIARLARQLGARAFLKEVYARGMFQKIDRDHRVVGLFDGNTLVNLGALISQFRQLARAWDKARQGAGAGEVAAALFRLDARLPPVELTRLSLLARGSTVLASLPDSVARLERAAGDAPDDGAGPAMLRGALGAARQVADAADQVHAEMADTFERATTASPRAFELARQYALCFAAAACLGLWAHNRAGLMGTGLMNTALMNTALMNTVPGDPLWQDGVWLRAALHRLLTQLDGTESGVAADPTAAAAYCLLLSRMCGCRDRGELFSLFPLTLAGGGTGPRGRDGGASAG